MIRFVTIAALLVSALCMLSDAHALQLKKDVRYRLFFPSIVLAVEDGERIESLEIFLSCGEFRGVSTSPHDWSVEIISPSSDVTTLRASAGHGATSLWNISDWNGAIVLEVTEPTCFEVSAVVTSAKSGQTVEHKIGNKELILRQ